LAEIIRFRMLMIAAGYEDGNDADTLRCDPMFKLALDRLPSDEELCSQSTISRLENLPDVRALLRLGRALIEQYCASFRQPPKRIVLDIDDTFDRVHGGQQPPASPLGTLRRLAPTPRGPAVASRRPRSSRPGSVWGHCHQNGISCKSGSCE
jgi:hypothetical protein